VPGSPLLVLDEQLESQRLVAALSDRGCDVGTVGDFGAQGRPDPDVVRRIAEQHAGDWVLVTMDLSIVEDFKGFDWDRYAIAWVRIRKELRGAAVEIAKANAVHKHLDRIKGQRPGDHFTYSPDRYARHPPSLAAMTEKRI
jgi:hypothetical protein